ncbi:MAG TPA: hypothetical protein VM324_04530 [Egibacteraceae bacterium]|nr:hypothetical protein [Egibacteraceae bacterium]
MRLRVAALMVGALLVAAAPVYAQVPDPGGLLPGVPGAPGVPAPDAPDDGAAPAPPVAGPLFAGVANAIGLELTLGGQGLTIGFTDARVQSGPTDDGCAAGQVSCARAAGELLFGETAEAFAPGNEGPTDATALTLPAELRELLDLNVGVAIARATAAPTANADAAAATVAVNATRTLSETLPLQDTLRTISDSILGPVGEGDPTGTVGPRLRETLDFIIENLDQVPLATIDVGPSSSESVHTGGVTRALATAQGAKLVLVPTPAQELLNVGIEGLVIVEVGTASAQVSTDAVNSQASADPAIVRVSVLDTTTLSYDVIELVPGASQCLAEGTPLRICISLAGSEVVQEGPNAAAAAQAVQIRAFADPLPELRLSLADVEAGVSAAAAAPPQPPPPPTPGGPPLPTTGLAFLLPGLALIGVGGASFVAVRRLRM